MKQVPCLGFLIVVGLANSSAFAADVPAAKSKSDYPATYVTPKTVKDWIEQEQPLLLLDVRDAEEFEVGHIPGARNIHYPDVAANADTLPKDQPIVLYCIHSAHRAQEAAKTLEGLGFQNAVVLEGGIVAWEAEGLTIRATDLVATPRILPKTEECDKLGATQSSVTQ
jgi:thiosulfate sulfurtransferase